MEDGSFIADLLLQNHLRLKMLKEEEIDLEDVFMGITKGITNYERAYLPVCEARASAGSAHARSRSQLVGRPIIIR